MTYAPLVGVRLRTATAVVLVATIALIAPLVRATAHWGPSTSAPLRLNRGFEPPPSKCTIVPPADAPRESVEHLAQPFLADRFGVPAIELPADSTPTASPDALRGPPLRSLS